MMIVYQCDYRGEKYDGYPDLVDLANIGEFLSNELGIWGFRDTGYVLDPRQWPDPGYPDCICGKETLGDDHFVLLWGFSGAHDIEAVDWADWMCSFHKECLPGFFELITGGRFIADLEEWMEDRDLPRAFRE